MSSRIDHETGIVTISAPCYSTMPPGHRLYVNPLAAITSEINTMIGIHHLVARGFEDWRARFALECSSTGRMRGLLDDYATRLEGPASGAL